MSNRQEITTTLLPNAQGFGIQAPSKGEVLCLTASPEGLVMHMLSDVDDILVERHFAIAPSGSSFEIPGKRVATLPMVGPHAFHLFELDQNRPTIIV